MNRIKTVIISPISMLSNYALDCFFKQKRVEYGVSVIFQLSLYVIFLAHDCVRISEEVFLQR